MTVREKSATLDPIRVLIADDYAVIGQAFRLVLENAGMQVVAVVADGKQAVEGCLKLRPDVALLDIVMPAMDGLAALSVIRYLLPELHVFMLTSHDEKLYMARAAELGANGFFSKGVQPEHMVKTLRMAVMDRSAPKQEPLAEGPGPPSVPGFTVAVPKEHIRVDLTDQEKLILTLLAMGYSSQAITEQLSVSRNTLKTHLRNIYEKLGVSDRTQAVIWAIRAGLTPLA